MIFILCLCSSECKTKKEKKIKEALITVKVTLFCRAAIVVAVLKLFATSQIALFRVPEWKPLLRHLAARTHTPKEAIFSVA